MKKKLTKKKPLRQEDLPPLKAYRVFAGVCEALERANTLGNPSLRT